MRLETKENKNIKSVHIHPKTCDTKYLFGHLANDGYHTWSDGVITKFLRSNTKSDENFWMILDGPVDYHWFRNTFKNIIALISKNFFSL